MISEYHIALNSIWSHNRIEPAPFLSSSTEIPQMPGALWFFSFFTAVIIDHKLGDVRSRYKWRAEIKSVHSTLKGWTLCLQGAARPHIFDTYIRFYIYRLTVVVLTFQLIIDSYTKWQVGTG
jgi:hypothetical protein